MRKATLPRCVALVRATRPARLLITPMSNHGLSLQGWRLTPHAQAVGDEGERPGTGQCPMAPLRCADRRRLPRQLCRSDELAFRPYIVAAVDGWKPPRARQDALQRPKPGRRPKGRSGRPRRAARTPQTPGRLGAAPGGPLEAPRRPPGARAGARRRHQPGRRPRRAAAASRRPPRSPQTPGRLERPQRPHWTPQEGRQNPPHGGRTPTGLLACGINRRHKVRINSDLCR